MSEYLDELEKLKSGNDIFKVRNRLKYPGQFEKCMLNVINALEFNQSELENAIGNVYLTFNFEYLNIHLKTVSERVHALDVLMSLRPKYQEAFDYAHKFIGSVSSPDERLKIATKCLIQMSDEPLNMKNYIYADSFISIIKGICHVYPDKINRDDLVKIMPIHRNKFTDTIQKRLNRISEYVYGSDAGKIINTANSLDLVADMSYWLSNLSLDTLEPSLKIEF